MRLPLLIFSLTLMLISGLITFNSLWVEVLAALHRFELWCWYSGGIGITVYTVICGAIVIGAGWVLL